VLDNKENYFSTKHEKLIQQFKRVLELDLVLTQSNKELLKLNTDKDLFLSVLSHDLKSPFNALLGFSKLLLENIYEYDIETIKNHASTINKSAENTYNLLEDLLIWTQSQSGNLPYKPKVWSFNTIYFEILDMLNQNAKEKNITINHYFTEELSIFADNNMLKAVLRNLISNSIKFTNPNGTINIYAKQNPENVTITVSDNGVGIKLEDLRKLFDVSHFKSTIGTNQEKGTGIGLLICKEFIEKHGGKIWVESEVGKGSDFKFTLPNGN
jgi:signal transduction histidine kinase